MAKNPRILTRDGNVNALNSDMSTETLYTSSAANMGDQPFLMDVSERGHAEILDELTDLSANKGAYALREVYSNAHDATVRVGDMTRPIEITIPDIARRQDSLAEKLAIAEHVSEGDVEYAIVTDHGIGMTEYDLRTYFTQYGGSNKRGDAASIGSKGLGSKAPLAVADYFDVVTCKDGVRTSMHLWRGEDGNYAEVTGSEPCPDDETGTSVRIPVTSPAVGAQMLECAQEIARYNSDAVVVVNGSKTENSLCHEPGGISVIGETSYVYLGEVTIARDQDGRPVSVPTWLSSILLLSDRMPLLTDPDGRRDYLSRLDCGSGGIRAVLCGIGYQLVAPMNQRSSDRYARRRPEAASDPVCIVEIEPGYLNFTVSRDEIKSDSRKSAFVDALRDGVDSLDLWPIVIKRAAHDFDALSESLSCVSLRRRDGRWEIVENRNALLAGISHVLTPEEESAFEDEQGRSMLPLLATFDGCDEGGHESRLLAWFSSASNGKSARFHGAMTDTYRDDDDPGDTDWASELLSWTWGTSPTRGADGENTYAGTIESVYDVVSSRLGRVQMASAVRRQFRRDWSVMVIGGVDDRAFAKAEHSIRRHVAAAVGKSTIQSCVLYVLCDGPVSLDPSAPGYLTDAERALLDLSNGHVEVAMLDELIRRCAKEDRDRSKASSAGPRRKGPKPLGTFPCVVATIDSSRFSDPADVVAASEATDDLPGGRTDSYTRSDTDLDALGQDDLVVIGCPNLPAVRCVAAQAMLLQKMGELDDSFDRIVFVPASHDGSTRAPGRSLYAPQVQRLAKQVTVLADMREQWAVTSVPSVFSAHPFIVPGKAVDIDAAGIPATDDIAVLVATKNCYLGRDGQWFLDNFTPSLPIARKLFEKAGRESRFDRSLLEIRTQDAGVTALQGWMERVWAFVGSYPMSSAVANADDADILAFVKAMTDGVMEFANEEYEAAVAKAA